MTEWSDGDVTFTIVLSCTWSSSSQPTPQYGQIVFVTACCSSSQVPAARMSCSLLNISAPVGQTPMQLPQYTQALASSGTAYSVEIRRVEPPARHGDRERVLRVGPACLDALVAEHAPLVVADVELVVDLDRLRDGLRDGGVGVVVVPRLARVPLPRRHRLHRGRRTGRGRPRTRACHRCQSAPPARCRRWTRGTPSRACGTCAPARCRSSPSCRARPSASTPGRARARLRAPRRTRGTR